MCWSGERVPPGLQVFYRVESRLHALTPLEQS
jgi:hypothetical protein